MGLSATDPGELLFLYTHSHTHTYTSHISHILSIYLFSAPEERETF